MLVEELLAVEESALAASFLVQTDVVVVDSELAMIDTGPIIRGSATVEEELRLSALSERPVDTDSETMVSCSVWKISVEMTERPVGANSMGGIVDFEVLTSVVVGSRLVRR